MCSSHNDINELFNTLCRSLSESGLVVSASEQFASLNSNRERVKFTYDLLGKFGLWPRGSVERSKSDELSREYREKGNQAFKTKKDGEALEMYTKSIALAEGGSEALGLAFANRSAVLFERKLFTECLEVRNTVQFDYLATDNYFFAQKI